MSSDTDKQGPSRDESTGEFFSVGSPLHAVRAGYIRRRADDLLYESVVAGRYAHVIAPDRCGKSSLIAATQARLENHGFAVAVLDLEQIGVRDGASDAGRWYYNVAYRLLRQLRIRFDLQAWWQDKAILNNRQRLLEFYSEVILQSLQQHIVVFVDALQCIEELPFADQLLASIRLAHNARTTDPEFSRLTFVMIGECDPVSLINEAELSPFNVTQPIPLDDFSREDLNIFATELNMSAEIATAALDRIYHWTRGQPYLSQKLARAVAREFMDGDDVEELIDRLVTQQLAGRAALHSEPHLSHIHRQIVSRSDKDAILNLYGRIRKGIGMPADLGSAEQRRLMAVGLVEVDDAGDLRIRNRIYARVFTAGWANENLGGEWRTPTFVALVLFVVLAIPLWYTQWLPRSYVALLTSTEAPLAEVQNAWLNLRSFPGHSTTADNLYRSFLRNRAGLAQDADVIEAVAEMAADLPASGIMPQQLRAGFWDRQTSQHMQRERRDAALLASLESLVLSTAERRSRSAMLVGEDYPLLRATLAGGESPEWVFDPVNLVLTTTTGPKVSQWTLTGDGLTRGSDWTITALEVTPLVRRVIVESEGVVRRAGLTLNLSHPRLADLRIRIIAPSGRVAEIVPGRERAASNEDIRIPAEQLAGLIGEPLQGTWSISLRDEATGIVGRLVGWNLTLNSQGNLEDFQRGLTIPDPIERETENYWISPDGRYAVARATQSDSARVWDLALAKPVGAVAVAENEVLVGLDDGARHLVTATFDAVNLWSLAGGRRVATLAAGPGSEAAMLTADGRHLLVQQKGDLETRLALWRLADARRIGELTVAGAPALVAVDASGARVAIADYDRAVRVWELESGRMLAQLDLPLQPSAIRIDASGEVLGAIFGRAGLTIVRVDEPSTPLLEEFGDGSWQLRFSPSGARALAGRVESGFQLYALEDGRQIGPLLGLGANLIGISRDEQIVVTQSRDGALRFWQTPAATVASLPREREHAIWTPSGDPVVAALPDASSVVVADRAGHVHLLASDDIGGALARETGDVSFLGHSAPVRGMTVSPNGEFVASFAADNSIQLWRTADGLPVPLVSGVAGSAIQRLEFSADNALLAVLSGNRATIIGTADGAVLADLELGETHSAMGFGADNTLYLGSETGVLQALTEDAAGAWVLRRVWNGAAAIRRLQASPDGRHLVVVDATHLMQQFNLQLGAPETLQLRMPAAVEDVAFSPGGSRLLVRTPRWVHRLSSSDSGLIWLDALLVPRALRGSRIVFGDPQDQNSLTGNAFYLPVARDGTLRLDRFRFSGGDAPGLFGNKDELLAQWRARLGQPQAADQR